MLGKAEEGFCAALRPAAPNGSGGEQVAAGLLLCFGPLLDPALFDRNDLGWLGLEFSHFGPKIKRHFLPADIQNEPLLRYRRRWLRNEFVFHDCDISSETGAEVAGRPRLASGEPR